MNFIVNIVWNDEAAVWNATSDAAPSLALESGSIHALGDTFCIVSLP